MTHLERSPGHDDGEGRRDAVGAAAPLTAEEEAALRAGFMPNRPDYIVPRLLAALDAARLSLNEHIPAVGGYCDSGIYLECSCGWSDAGWNRPTLDWEAHLVAATAASAVATAAPLDTTT